MGNKPESQTTIGLELEGSILKSVVLHSHKGKPQIDHLEETPIDLENVNPLYMNDTLHENIQKYLSISALNTQDVLIRQLEIKLKKQKDIEDVLTFQAEPLLPYPVENAVVDYIKTSSTQEGTLLSILAARKDHIQQHLEQWSKLQINPEVITTVPVALTHFANTYVPSKPSYYIVHIGLEQSSCILVHNSKPIAAQAISQGILHLKNALINDTQEPLHFGDIDLSQLDNISHPTLFLTWEMFRLEIKRLIFSLSKLVKDEEPLDELLITGTGALIPHLANLLAEDLQLNQIYPDQNLFPKYTVGQVQNFAIPIGAALEGLPAIKDKINFRSGEFSYPHPWKRLKSSFLTYAGLCIGVAISFYLFSLSYLSYREDKLRQSYVELLDAMNKSYQTVEEEYLQKKYKITDPLIIDISELNQNDLQERIQYLEKGLQSMPSIYPLLPNTPKVSDVLAWLSTRPVLTGTSSETDLQQPIRIESFSYTLVKRPELNKKQEKYQVKIELEFTSQTPKQAREFHDLLIEPNDFVDPKGEVKWNSNHGRYKTSFYLKDKTVYQSL